MIRVTDGSISEIDDQILISAKVDGEELYFKFPNIISLELRGELFLPFALFLAFRNDDDVVFDDNLPICPDLHEHLGKLKTVYRQWNPDFRDVEVSARSCEPTIRNDIVLSSFSGGIDSSYTLLVHEEEISHLLVMNGFDIRGGAVPFSTIVDKHSRFAESIGKTLIPVETNVVELGNSLDMDLNYLHGAYLCGIGAALAVRKFIIASSYTYRTLKPWGSHPLLDPLWSTAQTAIVHDDLISRTEKTVRIANDPRFLKNLQVCWTQATSNCGKCSKCVRTMIVLQELGAKDVPFPDIDVLSQLSAITYDSDLGASFGWDMMVFLREQGNEKAARELRKVLDRYLKKRSLDAFLKSLLGRKGRTFINKIRKRPWLGQKIMVRDPDAFD